MKILLLNEGYSDNLGDQAINDSLQYLLKEHNIDFQDFTKDINNPLDISICDKQSNKKLYLLKLLKKIIPSKIKWIIKNIKRVIKTSKVNYDLVIIGGGQLILTNATFSIAMFCWICLLRLFGNTNIVLFAVGSGTKFSFIDNILYKFILNRVTKVFVRDKKSQDILKNNFNINANFVYDVAFIHNLIIKEINNNKANILLGIISFNVYNRYNKELLTKEDFFETWIKLLKDNSINIKNAKLFYTTEEDRVSSLEFKEYIIKKYKIELELIETNTKNKLINEFNNSNLIISARMHALILGLTYKCKIIGYPISDKLIEFNNMFNKDFILSDIQENIQKQIKQILLNNKRT